MRYVKGEAESYDDLRAEIERLNRINTEKSDLLVEMDRKNRTLRAERDELQLRIDRIYQSAAINWLVDDYAQTVKKLRTKLDKVRGVVEEPSITNYDVRWKVGKILNE